MALKIAVIAESERSNVEWLRPRNSSCEASNEPTDRGYIIKSEHRIALRTTALVGCECSAKNLA